MRLVECKENLPNLHGEAGKAPLSNLEFEDDGDDDLGGGWMVGGKQTISGETTTITKTNMCEGHEKTAHSGHRLFPRV